MKVEFFFLLCTCVCCSNVICVERTVYNNFIVVSHELGNNTESCLNGTSPASSLLSPCKTLDYVFTSISNEQRNGTKVILEQGTYNLTKNATFEGIFDLGIIGNGSRLDINIFCSSDVGFTFIRSWDIQLQNITISHCGALHHSTIGAAFEKQHKNHTLFYCGVFMAYCRNITIIDSRISDSRGIGLALYDIGDTILIDKTHFIGNTPSMNESYAQEHNYAFAGGGVYMELTFDGALPPFDFNDPERLLYQHNNHYLFDGCTFEENRAPKQYFNGTFIEFPEGTDHMPFGRGGGMSIFVKGNATNNTFTVHESQFFNNTALWGAGLFVEFQDRTEDNHLRILNSNFQNNTARLAGGGVRSGIPIWKERLVANTISQRDNIFNNNQAMFGGGVSHYGPFNAPMKGEHQLRKVKFIGCTWTNNRATLGAAIGLSTSIIDLTLKSLDRSPMFPYIIVLENVAISNNRIILTGDSKVVGQGAVYSSGVPIVFRGNTLFEDNSQTALVLDSAFMKAYDNMTFSKNTGMFGGAIGFYGMSFIELMPRVKVNFTQNHATEKGGAMYVARNGPPILEFETTELDLHYCFIGYNGTNTVHSVEKWEAEMIFDSNTAKKGGGNSVYAFSLQTCRKPGESRDSNKTMEWGFITYKTPHVNIGEEISTDPINIVIKTKEWNVSPGEVFHATIHLYDEKNSSVQGIVNLSLIEQKSSKKLNISSPLLLIDPANNNTDSKVFNLKIQGPTSCSFDLTLTTLGGQTLIAKFTDLNLTACPPGFEQGDDLECTCLEEQYGVSRCSEGKNVYLISGYWGGMVGSGNKLKFVTYPCPPGYCSKDVTTIKTGDFLLNPHRLCAKNRNQTSVLCGECQDNCSVLIGSETCGDTNCDTTLYWFVPVFCVLSAIFVFIVLALDFDIFTVYLNAWLYFYQILPHLVNEDNGTFPDDGFLSFVIGLANWRIRISKLSICVKGLTAMQKLLLEYSFPTYIFFVLLVSWLISKCCRRCPNINTTRAICNLLVLVYTDLILISFKIIRYVHLNDKWVFYFDGSISFGKGCLAFTIPAIILLVLALTLAFLLLCIPQLCYCVSRSPKYQSVRLFFDYFQSCFEDLERQRIHRWFAGFYFLCRFVIFLLALFVPFGPLRRSILEASCVLIAGVFLFIKPYNTRYWWLNISDAVLLLNLCLVAIFSTAITHDYKYLNHGLRIVVHVLAYVPLLYLGILFCTTCRQCWQKLGDCRQPRNDEEPSTSSPVQHERSPLVTDPNNSPVTYNSTSPVAM